MAAGVVGSENEVTNNGYKWVTRASRRIDGRNVESAMRCGSVTGQNKQIIITSRQSL